MILWSVLNTYLRQKPNCGWAAVCVSGMMTSPLILLLGSFLLEPLVEVLLRIVDGQNRLHSIMCEAAQFGAGDFVGPGPSGSKPDLDSHTRHGILFDSQIRQKETVNDIHRAESHSDRTARRNVH